MSYRVRTVCFLLLLSFAACAGAQETQPQPVPGVAAPAITVERATGTLTIITEYAGTVSIDGAEITTVAAGEEIVFRNVPVGLRRVDLHAAAGVITGLAKVERDKNTTVRLGKTTNATVTMTQDEEPAPRSLLGFGAGICLYDMQLPVVGAGVAYSYYADKDIAIGAFIGLQSDFGVARMGLQLIFGDTRSLAAGVRFGSYLADRVPMIGAHLYLYGSWFAVDYSFADSGFAGEIHIELGYSIRF